MAPLSWDQTNGNSAGYKRPIRIAGASGGSHKSLYESELVLIPDLGVYDRKRAIHDLAKNEDVDVITGTPLEEFSRAYRKQF